MLPNFIIAGTARSGTTFLFNVLRQHPDIYFPDVKELHFFNAEEEYAKGLAWYEREFFSGHSGEKIITDATPDYMYVKDVPARIARDIGTHVKLLFILRHPVDRAFSHYQMCIETGNETKDFMRAVELEPQRLATTPGKTNIFSYMDKGHYAGQIRRFLDIFPRENMIFLVFEEFVRDKEKHLGEIQDFLGVDRQQLDLDVGKNVSSTIKNETVRTLLYQDTPLKRMFKKIVPSEALRRQLKYFIRDRARTPLEKTNLSPETRQKLFNDYFRDEIPELEKITGCNLDIWRG